MKKIGIIGIAILILLSLSSVIFADEWNGLELYTLTAKYNGKNLKDGDTIVLEQGYSKTISLSVNPEYVDDSLVIGWNWGNTGWNTETGVVTASFNIPDFEPGTKHALTLESYIEHNKQLPDGNPDRYVGNSNRIVVIFEVAKEEVEITVDLKDGSKVIKNNSTVEKGVGEKLNIVATSNVAVKSVAYRWGDEDLVEVSGSSTVVVIPTIANGKTMKLAIQAKAVDGTKSSPKEYYIKNPETAPEEKVSLTIARDGDYAVATPKIENGTFKKFTYKWDNDPEKETTANPLRVSLPTTVGVHTLKVRVYTNSNLTAEDTYTYEVKVEQLQKKKFL